MKKLLLFLITVISLNLFFSSSWAGSGDPVLEGKQVTGTLGFDTGTTIDEFSTDGTLAGNSDNALPTEKAVKTYSQPLDSTLTSIAGGTIGENLDNTANPWADNEVSGDQTLDSMKLKLLTSEESIPVIGIPIYVDNDTFDPCDVSGVNNYYAMLTRNTTELMPNAIDRTFTGGATAWANVDLNAFHETTDLTITATVADQYCTCPVDSAPTTVGKRYRMTYDLANIVSTWTLKSFDGMQTIGTISANASQGSLDWTATTTGGYRIVATSTTSSGDFDNFTLNELPYIAIVDESGRIFASSIELPCYSHWATGDATYNDTTTPHVLTSEEMKGGLVANCGATEDRVYTCGPAEFGINFVVSTCVTAVSRQMDLEPHSGEAFIFNENQMAVDEHIQNAADTKGQTMSCWSMETGDGTYEIFCKSDNANWVEATP